MQFKNIYNVELTKPLEPTNLRSTFLSQDNLGNRIGIRVFENGEPYALSGGCSGLVQRNDGNTVTVPGVVSGNTAYIDLPESAYAVAGPVVIAIKVVTGDTTTTGLLGYGTVVLSSTGAYIDPGKAVPDVTQIVALYNQMQTATTAAESATAAANTAAASANAAAARASGVSVITQYYLSTSDQTPTGGAWQDTVPEYAAGKYYWTRQKTVYGDGSSATGTAYPLQPFTNAQNAAQYVAPAETSPAAAAHAAGEYLIYNGALYTVAAPIAAGDALTVGGNILAAAKGLGGKLDRLNSAVKAEALHPIYDNEMDGLYISGSVWAAANAPNIANCGIFPVKSAGASVYIEGNGATSTVIAALRSHPAGAVAGDSVDFSQADGWTAAKTVAKAGVLSAVLPDDCQYLYVYYGLNHLDNRLPKTLMLNGLDLYAAARDAMGAQAAQNKADIASMGLVSAAQYITVSPFYIDNSGVWKQISVPQNARGFMLYPIAAGDDVAVYGKTGVTVNMAVLADYITPIADAAALLSTAEGFTVPREIGGAALYRFTAPADARYLYVYLGLASGALRMPACVYVNGFDILAGARGAISAANSPLPLRVMQYNIGKFNWGTAGGLSEADYAQKLPHYKNFLCKYHPDVISLEEFVEYMDADSQHRANDVLFDALYPNEVLNATYQRNIKTKFELLQSAVGSLTSSGKYARYSFARIRYGTKALAVLCTALPHQKDAATMAARAELLTLAAQLMADDDYAIIALDENNNGNGADVDSEAEGASLETMMQALGWKGLNGGYLPFAVTHPADSAKIDNIFYKANGKIIMNDFRVLAEEYELLSSDHYPVIGDFLLL